MLGGFQTDWAVFPVALSFDFVRNEAPVRPQIPAKAGIGGGEDEAVSAEVLFLSPWTPACAGVSGREESSSPLSSRNLRQQISGTQFRLAPPHLGPG